MLVGVVTQRGARQQCHWNGLVEPFYLASTHGRALQNTTMGSITALDIPTSEHHDRQIDPRLEKTNTLGPGKAFVRHSPGNRDDAVFP